MKWLVGVIIVCSSLLSDIIAIASDGDKLSSSISLNASRSDYYIFINEEGNILEILNNSFKDIKGGASSKLVELLKNKRVSSFIASNVGYKLKNSLNSNKIKYTIYNGTIDTFIEQLVINEVLH